MPDDRLMNRAVYARHIGVTVDSKRVKIRRFDIEVRLRSPPQYPSSQQDGRCSLFASLFFEIIQRCVSREIRTESASAREFLKASFL